MRLGAKSLILLALFISSAASAQWDTNAWPSDSRYRIQPADYPTATNAYAMRVELTVEQYSTTNVIPELFDGTNIVDDVYADARPDGGTNYFTNRVYGPVGVYTNAGSRAYTNTFLDLIRIDADTNLVETWWTGTASGGGNAMAYEVVTTNDGVIVTNNLTFSPVGVQTNQRLPLNRVWAYQAYEALIERVRVSDGDTNVYVRRANSDDLKPRWGDAGEPINDRDNLVRFKVWLGDNLGSFVRTSAESGGTFDAYFASPTDWQWQSNVTTFVDADAYDDACSTGGTPSLTAITETNANWFVSGSIDSFPVWSTDALSVDLGLPHRADVQTNTYTATVPGWFVGDTNAYYTNVTFAHVSTNISATWFDWTPYRDLGGWVGILSNQNDGAWNATPWDSSLTNSAYNDLYDMCGGVYRELRQLSPVGSSPTQTIYQIERVYVLTTNAASVTTGSVTIAHSTNVPHEAFTVTNIVTTNAAQIVTNYLNTAQANTNDYPSGWFTNIVFGPITYTNNPGTTNLPFSCVVSNIAPGYSDADYGYAQMTGIVNALVYTYDAVTYSGDTGAFPNIGLYIGFTCTTVAVDSAPFYRIETNAAGNPFGYKIAYAVTNAPSSDFAVTLCTNDVSCPASYGDLSGSVKYQTIDAGCYYVTTRSWDGTGVDCSFINETFADSTEQYDAQTDVIVDYEYCCIPTNFPVDPVASVKYQKTYSKIPCEVTNYLDCVTMGTNTFVYSYGRRSMAVTWSADDPQLASGAAQYYRATNPATNGALPDSEAGWPGTLTNYLAEFVSRASTGSGAETNFYTTGKPFGGDTLETSGWEILNELILFRWNITNGFQYR